MNEDKILEKLIEHDKHFDFLASKLLEHDGRFERIESKLTAHDERFERIESKLVEHDAILALKSDKDDIQDLRDTVLGVLDKMNVTLNRVDQERIVATQWNKNMQRDIEELQCTSMAHEDLLKKVKVSLGIA